MNEVDFTGWDITDDNLYKIRISPKYRWKIHWSRFIKAIKQKRWNWFTWWNIKGLLFNETKQF